MISLLALLVIVLVIATLGNGQIGNMIAGGAIALILFHPNAQELRTVLQMLHDVGVKEIVRATAGVGVE
jgi:ABC-type sugar transport system substrate-binding protein